VMSVLDMIQMVFFVIDLLKINWVSRLIVILLKLIRALYTF